MIDLQPIKPYLPAIRSFADIPFQPFALRQRVTELGWPVVDDLSSYTNKPDGFCIVTQMGEHRFCIIVDDERMAGVSLCALAPSEPCDNNFQVPTQEEYHACFDDLARLLAAAWGQPRHAGSYEGGFRYALWRRAVSWIAAVEHHEGDANFGHDATVDIRILPGQDAPVFPLITNSIF